MRLDTTSALRAAFGAPGLFLLALLLGTAPAVAQITLPVTFEESIDYELRDFEPGGVDGPTSVVTADPTDATNTVVQTDRPSTAVCYAGTTLAQTSGFAQPIPFTADATTMSARVWSPEAGALVLFKVEDKDDAGVFVETYTYTTVAGGWETMVFDFADPKPNGQAINLSATYNKASIFFDFQCGSVPATTLPAANRTYYFDDVAFGDGAAMGNAEDVVINEVDSDQTSTDAAEFVELYNTGTTSADLSGHALVFFNGSDDLSYEPAFDLDGVSIAAGEYYVICGDAANVDNCDMEVGAGTTNLIQNGADAVALVMGDAADFPNDTAVPTSGVIDAVVYGTGDADAAGLLSALGETTQYDEDLNGNKDTESVQRTPDGAEAFVVAGPTPGEANATIAPEAFSTIALGANEVPAVTSDGVGAITAVLTGTELVVTGRFDGLGSAYQASHLHEAAAGANGGVVQALSPTVDADGLGGTFEEANNTFTVSSDVAQALRDGLIYINIHTTDNAGGEIRGQFSADPPMGTALTLSQARTVGTGFNVMITGTVSRAAGAFSYIQDDTGGLTIRQTSGAYFDEVAGGTIQSGTEVTVTGTLSEFNDLLQINGGDLDSYSVGSTGDAPEATTVTLAELAADGETYEGQLVTILNATFADTGNFAASTNYDISDVSSSSNEVAMRVPGANDTDAEDTAIPSGPTNITGVVGEFRGNYQILLIQASDLSMGVADEAGPEAEGFALRAANPSPAGASVTLSAPVAGEVTLELVDALGRRVATLIDGPVSGEQTVRLSDALATGVYVLRLSTEQGQLARTITVVR